MTGGVHGRVAIVTGAARGIGAAVVETLARAGAALAAVDVDADGVRLLAQRLTRRRYHVDAYPADVRSSEQVDEVVARVEKEIGPIGILVNVAGVLRVGPATEVTDEDWAAVFDVNTHGVFRLCRAVVPGMMHHGCGTIVTIGSNAARVPRMHMAAYSASKAATSHFMRCLGLELAQYGIRCNVVAPGSTDTDMLRSMHAAGWEAAEVVAGSPATYRVGIPLGRLAQPQDIADAVAFLASDRARHITMQELCVDGGAALGS
jgi:2,3-dihydro-2,3-dihydroxybenzoate dehydrogenase